VRFVVAVGAGGDLLFGLLLPVGQLAEHFRGELQLLVLPVVLVGVHDEDHLVVDLLERRKLIRGARAGDGEEHVLGAPRAKEHGLDGLEVAQHEPLIAYFATSRSRTRRTHT